MEFKPGMRVIVEVDSKKGYVFAPLEDGKYMGTVIKVIFYMSIRSVQVFIYIDDTDFILTSIIIDNDLWYHGIGIFPSENPEQEIIKDKRKELNRLWNK